MSDYPDCVGRELARLREVGNAPTWSPIIDPELAKQFSEALKDEVDDTDDVDEDAFWNELDDDLDFGEDDSDETKNGTA